MSRINLRSAFVALAVSSSIPLALVGCEGGAPSTSSTMSTATVHGTVKYKGTPLKDGKIRFDPSNIRRKDAPIATADIKDGAYTVTTVQGTNVIRFELPNDLKKKEPGLMTFEQEYEVPSGDSTKDIDLVP